MWTYVVANMGTRQGYWGEDVRNEIRDMFGLTPNDDDVIKIEVHKGERWTLEAGRVDKMFEQAGWESPMATEFLFCGSSRVFTLMPASMDGHLPPVLRPGISPSINDKCVIDLDRCYGPFWSRNDNTSSADMFTRLAFQYPDCGDCSE